MKCIICNSNTEYFFSKKYTQIPFDEFMQGIGLVDYFRCANCGFVLSNTHSKLDKKRWHKLNSQFHHYLENPINIKLHNQPPYFEQAMMLILLGQNGLLDTNNIVDYAGGYGSLSRILGKYCDIDLPIYDPFVQSFDSMRYISKNNLGIYNTVINSAMFEHVLERNALENVNNIVSKNGVLILHTVVCENVPKDPNWFYLVPPVHTAFHTNKSMGILMNQWGYSSSIYCPPSKCWILLKEKSTSEAEKLCDKINNELQSNWFYFKLGFVDYWKGF